MKILRHNEIRVDLNNLCSNLKNHYINSRLNKVLSKLYYRLIKNETLKIQKGFIKNPTRYFPEIPIEDLREIVYRFKMVEKNFQTIYDKKELAKNILWLENYKIILIKNNYDIINSAKYITFHNILQSQKSVFEIYSKKNKFQFYKNIYPYILKTKKHVLHNLCKTYFLSFIYIIVYLLITLYKLISFCKFWFFIVEILWYFYHKNKFRSDTVINFYTFRNNLLKNLNKKNINNNLLKFSLNLLFEPYAYFFLIYICKCFFPGFLKYMDNLVIQIKLDESRLFRGLINHVIFELKFSEPNLNIKNITRIVNVVLF
jgi:hypothetical protein